MKISQNQSQKVSDIFLMEKALSYLARYQTTEFKLTRYLKQQIYKQDAKGEPSEYRNEASALIPGIIEKLRKKGYLNDKDFLNLKVSQYRRQGRSRLWIRAKLKSVGLSATDLDEELRSQSEGGEGDGDEAALKIFAERKKLGPYRLKKGTEDYQKDYQRLRRSGFSNRAVQRLLQFESSHWLDQDD